MPGEQPFRMDQSRLSVQLQEVARAYTEALKRLLGERLVSVVLYGSVARGSVTETSDIDLLIVAKRLPRDRFARRRLVAGADRAIGPNLARLQRHGVYSRVCAILKTRDEASYLVPLYLDFVEDALLLYDDKGFFNEVLDRLRTSLARLGARRRRLGSIWYWDLKPDYVPGEIFTI